GVADEHPAELHGVQQPAEQRVRQAEAPPRRHGDQRRAEDRAAEVARVRERRGHQASATPRPLPKCWTRAAASAAAVYVAGSTSTRRPRSRTVAAVTGPMQT